MIEPLDEHNRKLIDNVHPASWINPEPAARYHMVVVGAGTAGLVSAAGSRRPGREGGDHRAQPDGRRLSQRRLRPLQGSDPRRPLLAGGPRDRRPLRRTGRDGPGRRLRLRHGAHAPYPRRHQRARQRPPLPGSRGGRLPGRRPLPLPRYRGGRRQEAPLPPRRDRHRRPGRRAAHPGPGRGGLPHQRDDLQPHRAAEAAGGAGRRPHRLRAGPGLRPARQRGHAARPGKSRPPPRGRRRRRGRPEGDAPRRRPPRIQHQGGRGERPGRREDGGHRARRRAAGDRGGRDPARRRPRPQRRGTGAGGGGRALRQQAGRRGGRQPAHQQSRTSSPAATWPPATSSPTSRTPRPAS